jgi:hypothetical protein
MPRPGIANLICGLLEMRQTFFGAPCRDICRALLAMSNGFPRMADGLGQMILGEREENVRAIKVRGLPALAPYPLPVVAMMDHSIVALCGNPPKISESHTIRKILKAF